MGKKVVILRHGDDPPDDRTYTFLVVNGFEPVVTKPFAGELLGEPDESLAGTIIHGGGYNAYDVERHPFLREEYRWIDACLKAGVPMLGICLGAQQIAWHLGARVGPKEGGLAEFGYYLVRPAPNAADFMAGPTVVTQSHYHGFDIPSGAEGLASSDLFANQAFRYGERVYGLQFHSEVTIEGFRRWQSAPWAMYDRPGAQARPEQDRLMHLHGAAQAEWFYGFLGRLFGTAT